MVRVDRACVERGRKKNCQEGGVGGWVIIANGQLEQKTIPLFGTVLLNALDNWINLRG